MDDETAIRRVIERYASGADRREPDRVAALFTDDGELAVWLQPGSDASVVRSGRAEITTAIGFLERYRFTQHVISNSAIDVSGDNAHGETHCTAHHVTGTDQQAVDRTIYLRYSDDFVRVGGQWLIKRRELRAQWISTTPVEGL